MKKKYTFVREEHIAFLDPKGIRKLHANDSKIEFYKIIKSIETQLRDRSITLNSFIISNTPCRLVKHWEQGFHKVNFEKKHLFSQEDTNYIKQIFQRI